MTNQAKRLAPVINNSAGPLERPPAATSAAVTAAAAAAGVAGKAMTTIALRGDERPLATTKQITYKFMPELGRQRSKRRLTKLLHGRCLTEFIGLRSDAKRLLYQLCETRLQTLHGTCVLSSDVLPPLVMRPVYC
jgi:hypothetical protein